jgi:general secretion pathway protein B
MSFILDALRKSETERQRQTSPGLVTAGQRPPARRRAVWIPVLVVVLIGNFSLLAVLWWRDRPAAAPPAASAPATPAPPVQPPVARVPTRSQSLADVAGIAPAAEDFAAEVETAERYAEAPTQEQYTEVLAPPPDSLDAAEPVTGTNAQAGPSGPPAHIRAAALPTVSELAASGALALPELHLDIHVFSSKPAERFAFINMKKYTEGATLADGPRVEEISPDGVVLSHNGQRFLLTRD